MKSTRQKIRTQLKRLDTCGTIALQATNKFTLVTICNYDNYQESSEAEQPTDNQQTNQQITSKTTNTLTSKICSQVAHIEDDTTSSSYDSNQQSNQQSLPNLTSDLTTTKEYKNKEYISTYRFLTDDSQTTKEKTLYAEIINVSNKGDSDDSKLYVNYRASKVPIAKCNDLYLYYDAGNETVKIIINKDNPRLRYETLIDVGKRL